VAVLLAALAAVVLFFTRPPHAARYVGVLALGDTRVEAEVALRISGALATPEAVTVELAGGRRLVANRLR
jgi:hypothetical protein